MYTISYFPKTECSLTETVDFVNALPYGEWVADSPHPRGVIQTEDAVVVIHYDDQYFVYANQYEEERERKELESYLGFSPRIAVYLQATHHTGSKALARAIGNQMIAKWGGGCAE